MCVLLIFMTDKHSNHFAKYIQISDLYTATYYNAHKSNDKSSLVGKAFSVYHRYFSLSVSKSKKDACGDNKPVPYLWKVPI